MSLFPAPTYVPGATSTVSPVTATSTAAWIVGYTAGTRRVAAAQRCTERREERARRMTEPMGRMTSPLTSPLMIHPRPGRLQRGGHAGYGAGGGAAVMPCRLKTS